jgi:hypothetical protein
MPDTFAPPENPHFVFEVTDRFSTIVDPFERGHRATRARQDRQYRAWVLRWTQTDQATFDYIRAFIEFHLGGAVPFDWPLPTPAVYTPRPHAFQGSLLAAASGGSLATGTYTVRYTFANPAGETQASPSSSVAVTGPSGKITVTAPPRFPADCTKIAVYAALSPAAETKQGEITQPSGTLDITSLAAGAALPTANGMQGTPRVTTDDRPRYRDVAAGVWEIELHFDELPT